MINIDTYISILFSIIVAALLGSFITIYTQDFSRVRKRKMIIIVSTITIVLIIFLTIIYCYGRYEFQISLPSFSSIKSFDINNLLPFNKSQFLNVSFNKMYHINLYISVGLFVVGYIIMVYMDGIVFDKKYLLFTSIVSIFIISYLRLWEIYIICNLFYNCAPIWISYIIQSIIYIFLTFFELSLLSEINSSYYLKDISSPMLKECRNKLQNALDE